MSFETVKRTFSKLEKQGFLITGNFNKAPRDKTKWYTIDKEKLFKLYEGIEVKKKEKGTKALFENVDNSVGFEQIVMIVKWMIKKTKELSCSVLAALQGCLFCCLRRNLYKIMI